jgi:hypothetical protein
MDRLGRHRVRLGRPPAGRSRRRRAA